MVLQETGREDVDWMNLAQDADKWLVFVNTVIKLQFPQNAGKCLTSRRTISSSTRTVLHWVGWMIRQKTLICSVIDFPYVSSVFINNYIIFENRHKVTDFSFKIRKLPSCSLVYVSQDTNVRFLKQNIIRQNQIASVSVHRANTQRVMCQFSDVWSHVGSVTPSWHNVRATPPQTW
jgi:hypothetical protein